MSTDGNTIKQLVEELENDNLEGKEVGIEQIYDLEDMVNESEDMDVNLKGVLRHKLLKIKKDSLPSGTTKWDIFVQDMKRIKDIDEFNELIEYLDKNKDAQLTKEEIAGIENRYNNVLGLINQKLTPYDRDRATKEVNKKIKLFNNRLSRVIEDDFGAWIKQLRLAKKYSLKTLESISGVTASYIHRIENGAKKTPSVPVAEKLAEGLGVNPDEFLRRLNILSDGSSKKEEKALPLQQLISLKQFTLPNGEVANVKQKDKLLSIINEILESDWDSENQFANGVKIINLIVDFRKSYDNKKVNEEE